jgi:hypothetical protein
MHVGQLRREQAVPFECDFFEGLLRTFDEERLLGAPPLNGIHPVGDQSASGAPLTRSGKRDVGIDAEAHAPLLPGISKLQSPQPPTGRRDLEVHAPSIGDTLRTSGRLCALDDRVGQPIAHSRLHVDEHFSCENAQAGLQDVGSMVKRAGDVWKGCFLQAATKRRSARRMRAYQCAELGTQYLICLM